MPKTLASNHEFSQLQFDISWAALENCTEQFESGIIKARKALEVYEEVAVLAEENKEIRKLF